ncbi:MAG TPA: mechanosensitive ion channel [Verrucomicrobia bacterium]|mgnify:CR=1 FL=1|nr:mechanosensitive ion channel [Verrucomicrobiota bacterium]HOP98387.1 mechanosensitive ion channel [Verrucomicrobiota bacterium]
MDTTNIFDYPLPMAETQNLFTRSLLVIVFAVAAHVLVWLVRSGSDWLIRKSAARKTPVGFVTQQPKFITFTGLIASAVTFAIYFVAVGYLLKYTFNINLATYLATASVIGLAVGFGSQGLVQDVVTSLTLIVSDTLDVGDVIEVAGQVGRVEKVGLRFTELSNLFHQQVFVPNRMIANIGRFPLGGIYAYADVQIPSGADPAQVQEEVNRIAHGVWTQFSAIILSEPRVFDAASAGDGEWKYFRTRFKIWPGQGALIETTFRQRVVAAMKRFDPAYADWMVSVTYRATLSSGG